MNKKINRLKSNIMSDFIYWIFQQEFSNRKLHDYDFLLSQLDAGNQIFKLSPAQIIALYFQYSVQMPQDIKKSKYLSVHTLKKFMKKMNQNKFKPVANPHVLVQLPEYAFNFVTINKACRLIIELSKNEYDKNLSTDAKMIWDLNHFFFPIKYELFLEFLNMEYEDYKDQISIQEFFNFKVSQFKKLLDNKTLFKTSKCIYLWEKSSRKNLKQFISEFSIVDKPSYH